jgi:hypothetical protein
MSNLNIDEVYTGGGAFLKAADLNMRRANLTIKGARLEQMKDQQNKIVLDFVETEKTLVLNRINSNMIADLLGNRDAGAWAGSVITLRPDKTQDPKGNTVDCIRVDFELPPQSNPNSLGAQRVNANPAFGQNPAQVAQATQGIGQTQTAPNLSQQQPPPINPNDPAIPF